MATPIPANVAPFSFEEIVEATGARIGRGAATSCVGVTTDSRGSLGGKLFVALAGAAHDGHAYVGAALAAGAAGALVTRGADVPDGTGNVLEVDDTLVALGALARLHRRRWGGPIVAVAGSAGKTTTRCAVAAGLEAVHPGGVHQARGNLNNRVGAPMVLLGLSGAHSVGVVEVGTNERGEVAELVRVVEPDVGVMTLIAIEHSEGIGALDEIEAEEGDLFPGIRADGAAIANGDDARVRRQLGRCVTSRRVTFGVGAGCEYRIVRRESVGAVAARVTVERPTPGVGGPVVCETPLIGEPGARAVAAAIAVADVVAGSEVDGRALARALADQRIGEPGRLCPIELADSTLVLDDTYNANPASVRASLLVAREIADARGARLVLVLGEMRELGDLSSAEHDAVGRDAATSGAVALIAIGTDAERFVAPALEHRIDAVFVANSTVALGELLPRLQPGDVVLIKGSRGIRAERIVRGLVDAKGRAA